MAAVSYVALPTLVRAAPAFTCSFNGPDTAWEMLDNGVPARVVLHDCIPGGARDGDGIERIAVAATVGQSVMLKCTVPAMAVVDELQVRLWVKSNRPNIQLAARIALPRSVDPSGQGVATAIVKGQAYDQPGRWQQLVLTELPKSLAAQVRVMRTMQNGAVDTHEAYLESVVMIVPGDPNGVELGTDELEVEGVRVDPSKMAGPSKPKVPAKAIGMAKRAPRTDSAILRVPTTPSMASEKANSAASPCRLQGSTLMVEDKPFFPRGIQWNGEPLKFLAERGFNVVQLSSLPTKEQIADAKKFGLWFVCIPPRPEAIASSGLGATGDRVLAWKLEDEAIETDPDYASRWSDTIREHDALYGRPILISPDMTWGTAGKSGDILLAQHSRVSRLSEPEFETWLKGRPRLARPGTPMWVSLNSQFGEVVRKQANALSRTNGPAPAVDVDQLEMLLEASYVSGARGLVFQSNSSLAEPDLATRNRAAELELINWRLQLMEPWLAGGKVVFRVQSVDGQYEGVVMHYDRARLLMPFAASASSAGKFSRRPSAKEVTFVVPGVAESAQVYALTPVSISAISPQRVAGGTRLTMPAGANAMVLMTEDPQVVQALRQRIVRQANQTARLQRDFVVARAQSVFQIDQLLSQLNLKPTLNAAAAASMNTQLGQLDSLLGSGQLEEAQTAMDSISAEERKIVAEELRAAGVTTGLQSNALGLTYIRLAEFAVLQRSFENLRGGENLLPGGDFENLNEMTQLGWQHVVHPTAGAGTQAILSTDRPDHGSYCLELQAGPPAAGQMLDVATPRVWIVSPAVALEGAKTVEITGWVRIDKPFSTPGEGLSIIDSLGGPELSIAVGNASTWQMFRMVRAVPEPTDLRLTFALTGVGSAKVDAVMVRTLEQSIVRRLPGVGDTSTAQLPSIAPAAPIFGVPPVR
ncbi:MAG TPA: hypothetical protein VH107_12985 [Lacipirellulaceae bacterium]|nr:hypothetical protein [Lacipirellulaceae bacterium]